MAPKKRASGRSQRSQEAVDVVEGLAARLAQLGRRKWKVKCTRAAMRLPEGPGGVRVIAHCAHGSTRAPSACRSAALAAFTPPPPPPPPPPPLTSTTLLTMRRRLLVSGQGLGSGAGDGGGQSAG